MEHMSVYNLFSESQHGFISGKSCVTQLLEFLEDVSEALDKGDDVDVIYFRKAFDKVPHLRLLKKIWANGIQGLVYDWIKDFLHARLQRVIVDGNYSNFVPVTSGIPKGSVLGPILFVIYINDLPEVIDVCFKMFADDSKMYGRVKTVDQAVLVQDSINKAVKWAEDWQMFFNYNKCKHSHIGRRDSILEYYMHTDHGAIKIQNVNSENDLGLIVDKGLKFSEHINNKIAKANKILQSWSNF